jgi:hypothetical protein
MQTPGLALVVILDFVDTPMGGGERTLVGHDELAA